MMNQLVSSEWLEKNINNVKILDASWHLPNVHRNALEEYKLNHIASSIFFDIDKNSNQKTSLPHMLPLKEDWEDIVSNLGINNSDHIVIYDNSDVFSSCRVWYTFLYFGHNPNLVSVMNGDLKKWYGNVNKYELDHSTIHYLINNCKYYNWPNKIKLQFYR